MESGPRRAVVALVVASMGAVLVASGNGKAYAGQPQLDTSLSAEDFRDAVFEWCVEKQPKFAGSTPGAMAFNAERTAMVLLSSSAESFGDCSFDPTGTGSVTTGYSRSDMEREGRVVGGVVHTAGVEDLGGRVISLRVAPEVGAMDVRLPNGDTVRADVAGETAVFIVPAPEIATSDLRLTVRNHGGKVIHEGPF